jgi:Phage integrase family
VDHRDRGVRVVDERPADRTQQEAGESSGDYANPDRLVFTRENGDPWDPHTVYCRFVKTVKTLGYKPVALHLLRHIAASILIAAGVDIAIVSKRLGHSKIDLTSDTYGHLIGKAGRQGPRRRHGSFRAAQGRGRTTAGRRSPGRRRAARRRLRETLQGSVLKIPGKSPAKPARKGMSIDKEDRLRFSDLPRCLERAMRIELT